MQLLLDTHSFLWFIANDPKLSATAEALIKAPTNQVFLSLASVWEMAIKVSTGKLALVQPLDILVPSRLRTHTIGLLHPTLDHLYRVAVLPFHHRDRFDRLIAAQSLIENLPLVSRDPIVEQYGVQRLW